MLWLMSAGGAAAGGLLGRRLKADHELQIVWGEVYVPDFPDSQGDYMTSEEVRKMAHHFGRTSKTGCIDVNHDSKDYRAYVVETFIARPGDPDFIPGSWVVGVKIEDRELWDRIKKGELNGFSLEALVCGVEEEVEFNIPPEVFTTTLKTDGTGHIHRVRLSLDRNSQIIGGETDFVDGHRHTIKRGTA